jgi:hypothetical protein
MLDNAATAVPGGGASDPMANDKLGTDDFRKNPSWLRATERHLDALPKNRLVDAFRRYHFGAGGVNHDGLVVTPSPPGCGHPPPGCRHPADRVFLFPFLFPLPLLSPKAQIPTG